MSVLQAVMQYKAQQAEDQKAQADSILTATQLFQQARQQAVANKLDLMRLAQQQSQFDIGQRNELAGKGLKINTDGSFTRDESLTSPLDQYILKGKAVEAARNMGDRSTFNALTGQSNTPANPVTQPVQSAQETVSPEDAQLYQQANQIDPFTQKPTAEAEQAKAQLTEKTAGKTASAKAQSELNRKQGVLLRVGERIIDEYGKTNPSENRLLQLASIPGSYLQSNQDQKNDAVYRDFVNSLRAQLARGQGEVGNLSQTEQAVVLNAVGSLGDVKSVGYDKLINYFKNIKDVSTDKNTQEQANVILGKLENIKSSPNDNSKSQEPKSKIEQVANEFISPAASFVNNALAVPFVTSPKDIIEKSGGKYPEAVGPVGQTLSAGAGIAGAFANLPVRGAFALLKGAQAAANLNKAKAIMQQTAPVVEQQAVKAQSALTKLKGDEIINSAVKNARDKITGQGGYISQEHNIYSKAIDTIKGTDKPVSGADNLLSKFALNNKNETTGQFNTPEMQKVYDALNTKFANAEKITEADIVNSMKILKGKFGTGKVDVSKRMNLNAASDLAEGLSGDNLKILKAANTRYSTFKTNEKNIDELISIYGKAKKTDSVVSGLLSKDLGIEQSQVAKFIGDKTGLDLLNTINYHRGLNQVADSFWFTRQISSLVSGSKKVVKSKLDELLPKK